MASFSTVRADGFNARAAASAGVAAEAIAQDKLTRLFELRAVIDSLVCEREARDPLLCWVIARDNAEH